MKKSFKQSKIPSYFPSCIIGHENAPIFSFRSFQPTIARGIEFPSFNHSISCLPRIIRIDFHYQGNDIYFSKVFNLPNGHLDPIYYSFETDVIFDSFDINVYENWNDVFMTCLPQFHILGPEIE